MAKDAIRKGPEGGRAIERSARLLFELAKYPRGISLSELARNTGDSLATVHRTLAILRELDLTRETADGLQAIGVGAAVLSGAFFEGLDLRSEAGPLMRELVERTGETCHLGILSGAQIVYIEKFDSPSAVRMFSRVGGTNPALTTAIGKSILAFSSEETVAKTIELSLAQLGPLGNEDVVAEELKVVRRLGFGTDPEFNEAGIWCVGAPVFDHTGRPIAGISVSTPTLRFNPADETVLGRMISDVAVDLSRCMGYMPSTSSPIEQEVTV